MVAEAAKCQTRSLHTYKKLTSLLSLLLGLYKGKAGKAEKLGVWSGTGKATWLPRLGKATTDTLIHTKS